MRFGLGLCVLFCSATASAAPWFWQRGGTYINDLASASDGSVAVVLDSHLVLFGPDGKVRKQVSFGPRVLMRRLTFAPDKDLIVAGYFRTELDLGGTKFSTKRDQDGFIARFKPDGSLRWVKHVESDDTVYVTGIAATTDRVIATGYSRFKKGRVDKTEFAEGRGLVIVLDAAGTVLAIPQIDLGNEGELRVVCAAGDGFVVAGHDRRADDKHGFIRGLTKDGATRWTHSVAHEAEDVACRADGTVFVATHGQGMPPNGNYSQDLIVHELDRTGKPVRTISIITDVDDKPLHLSASTSELVVSSRHSDGKSPLWSRVSRFGTDGKLLGKDEYKGDETIYMNAMHGPRGLILVGEITKTAKLTIRGKAVAGPTLFVMAP